MMTRLPSGPQRALIVDALHALADLVEARDDIAHVRNFDPRALRAQAQAVLDDGQSGTAAISDIDGVDDCITGDDLAWRGERIRKSSDPQD